MEGQANGTAKDRPPTHGPHTTEDLGVRCLMNASAVRNGRALVLRLLLRPKQRSQWRQSSSADRVTPTTILGLSTAEDDRV